MNLTSLLRVINAQAEKLLEDTYKLDNVPRDQMDDLRFDFENLLYEIDRATDTLQVAKKELGE